MGNAKSVSAPTVITNNTHLTIHAPFPVTKKMLAKGRYHLNFIFHVASVTDEPITDDAIHEAYKSCSDSYVWKPYLEALMQDTLVCMIEVDYEAENVSRIPRLHVDNIHIKLAETKNAAVFRGIVSWNSRVLDKDMVWDAAKWRIGDRMSSYEIQDESAGWSTYIDLKSIRIEPKV